MKANKRSLNKKAKLYSSKGIRYFRHNKAEQALKYLSKATKLNSKSYETYNTRALIYEFDFNDSEKAIADYTRAIEIAPNNYDAYFCRANLYSQQKLYNLSIEGYTKALKLQPQYFQAYINRGKDYCYTENFEKAEKDFLIALNLAKNSKDFLELAYYNLGNFELTKGNYIKAIKYYTQAINQSQFMKIDSYFKRALCYMCINEFEKAILDFTNVIELANNDLAYLDILSESFYCRGAAYKEIGKKIEAVADFKKAEALREEISENKIKL